MNILYLIPARGGSKGLPGKNIKHLNGRPLIYYTIDAAREVSSDIDICVSTDDESIAEVVKHYGLDLPFIRPAELATDNATSEEVLKHAIQYYESISKPYDYVVLLQPTSPLRTGKQIKEALDLINSETEMIVSVKETDANPYYVLFEEDKYGFLKKSKEGTFTTRQDCPKVYELNGAIYIINIEKLKHKVLAELQKAKYVMDKMSSIDIDDNLDFAWCEYILMRK
ncbi:acylneuraminate cytidylyltransferase family protein [Pontibacter ramchanderi]|uniref:N-acylneuraminate cytidylyltransferase n=1 Tax=Pontibacter ramchanderi TaxID=1179743 RepID=A0A2N3U906_9BACT|nr:acylneuraminate cytidylyltransferase family protein [Pontibacter ramchanderi]PKV63226.1 N-acylneuraminate cytidylyltransferase [Pontibacter ramchanderi]